MPKTKDELNFELAVYDEITWFNLLDKEYQLGSELTCEDRRDMATVLMKAPMKEDGQLEEVQGVFPEGAALERASTWFFAVMDCQYAADKRRRTAPSLRMSIEITQANGSHFSFDSEGLLELH